MALDDERKKAERQEALDYHEFPKPGKLEIRATKPMTTGRDLARAYSPGVAEACLEIETTPSDARRYTAKGNLVAVISNGTAVLGLGNIGAQASKPVMEGKAVLFKKFAGIDCFDIEVDEEVLNAKIPPMLVQPIIENSVKHGISPLIEGGKIYLNIHKMGSLLQFVISDTGVGIEHKQKSDLLKNGIGLSNTEERLIKMYGKGIELTDNTPKGLTVKFDVPINTENKTL